MLLSGKPGFIGREEEVREISEVLRRAHDEARLLLLCGASGFGKTAVLEAALPSAMSAGVLVIRISPESYGELTLDAAADQVCEQLVAGAGSDVLPFVAAARRAQSQARRNRLCSLQLMLATKVAICHVASSRPVAVVLDDIHAVPDGDAATLVALADGLRSDGVCAVVSGEPLPVGSSAIRALASLADRTVTLSPLTWEETSDLVVQRLGWPAAPELMSELRRSLGEWAGNPRAVLSALDTLSECNRLLVVDGHVCLTAPDARIRLPGIRESVRGVAGSLDGIGTASADEALSGELVEVLVQLVMNAETTVDDLIGLSPELGVPSAVVGRLIDTMVEQGMVTLGGGWRLNCQIPGACAALRMVRVRWRIPRLHARVVLNAGRSAQARGECPELRLWGHALAAGTELPAAVSNELLLAVVRENGAIESSSRASASLALCWQLPYDDETLPGLLRSVMGLLLDQGAAGSLLELVEHLLSHGVDSAPRSWQYLPDLAVAWAVTTLHEQWVGASAAAHCKPPAREVTRVPAAAALVALAARVRGERGLSAELSAAPPPDRLPGVPRRNAAMSGMSVRDPVVRIPAAAETQLLSAAWGEGSEFRAALAAVQRLRAANGLPPLRHTERLRSAVGWGDWATAFDMLLGENGSRLEGSPLRDYQSLVREYCTGSLEAALALARRIETPAEGSGQGPLYEHSRSLAAEICRWQGDLGRAADWLARGRGSEPPSPLLSWARTGLRYSTGEFADAWREGWHDYRILRAEGRLAGLERLLLRLTGYSVLRGQQRVAMEARDALEELHETVGARTTHVAALLGRAAVAQDADSARAAYALLGRGRDQVQSFLTSLWLARSTGSEEWLAEAWEWCERLSSRRARQMLVQVSDALDRPLPRRRVQRTEFSRLEVDLVRSVAAGRTNRQIAGELLRSEKTVEKRLAGIFERTGCRSRLELATAWLDGDLARFVPE